jgi:NADP-dependent 3-hydroxy acid dehydrogenase YdfG
LHLEVTDEAAWAEAVHRIGERHGRLDLQVTSAGIATSTPMPRS